MVALKGRKGKNREWEEELSFRNSISRVESKNRALYMQLDKRVARIITSFSFIAIIAKLCSADGRINNIEAAFLKHILSLPESYIVNIEQLLEKAANDKRDFSFYARQIYNLNSRPQFFIDILKIAITLSLCDDAINRREFGMIKKMAAIFEVKNEILMEQFNHIVIGSYKDSYSLLGVNENDDPSKIKQNYHKMISECHPDKFSYKKEVATEYIYAMQNKLNLVKDAYNDIKSKTKS